jgi:putative nucleotidyltransferase with HDIG domain
VFKTKAPAPAQLVQEKLNGSHAILPFPQVVGQLLAAINDPSCSAEKLATIIESDAALALRLLRMANSPLYGCSNVIESVGRAITVLGNRPLKNIALTFAASSVFSGNKKLDNQREQLWHHSLGTATVARQLARASGALDPDDAFLAGVFHDVGKLFFFDVLPEEYAEMASQFFGDQLIENENERYQVNHQQVGVKLATEWQIPEKLSIAIGYHHQPEEAIAHKVIAHLIYAADAIARQAGVGTKAVPELEINQDSLIGLGVSDDTVTMIASQSLQQFEETKQACGN